MSAEQDNANTPTNHDVPIKPHPKLEYLIAVAHKLRSPGGCPWDGEQTHNSLTKYLLEETYELIDAIERGDRDEILEELGDVLYSVIFHADLAATGSLGEPFDLEDVAEASAAKMIGRHPHVFGNPEELERYAAKNGDEVMVNWDALKQSEKPHRKSITDGVPMAMPALALADKLVGKLEKTGIDLTPNDGLIPLKDEAELGQKLLDLVVSARAAGLEPERALRQTLGSIV
ncbi:MAG: hypothetical protein RLZZ164_41 [Actinomycetota bacterium]|jgi:XTP/dITP diphosphohydrolase